MKKKLLNKRSAMTLVELIIVVLLIIFVSAAATIIAVTSIRLFKTELSKSIVTDDLTIAIEWIKKDAMLSTGVNTAIANQITLDFEDFSVIPSVNSQIRYYVKSGTTELYRQIVGVAGDGKLITDTIDAGNLPLFSKPAESNYLLAEIWINDPDADSPLHQDVGVMLRCSGT